MSKVNEMLRPEEQFQLMLEMNCLNNELMRKNAQKTHSVGKPTDVGLLLNQIMFNQSFIMLALLDEDRRKATHDRIEAIKFDKSEQRWVLGD